MKKKLLNYFFLLSLSSSLLASDDSDYMSEDNNPATVKRASMGDITPAVNPVVKHGVDAFLFADFIYWTTRVDNLLSSQSGFTNSSDKNDIINNKKVVPVSLITDSAREHSSINHQMSPGFKVGAGFNFKHDGWDSLVRYTWLHGKASQNSNSALSSFNEFSSFVEFVSVSTSIGKESSNWNLHFNTIDWELGREFFISKNLVLRPVFGLKGSWQTQYYNKYLSDLSINSGDFENPSITTGSYTILQKQSYWGIGIRPGLTTSWELCNNFSIFGDAFVSALWSYFDSSRKDTASQKNTNNDPNILNFPNVTVTDTIQRNHSLCPVLELALGLRWETMCSNDDYRFRLQAGWEEQVFFNQNQFILINSPNSYGNLALQGLTIEARLDF